MQVDVKLNIEGSSIAVGRLSELADGIAFQYDTEFLHRGLQISPFAMPLSPQGRLISDNPFGGLPGVFADSLPDGWGNLLWDRQLQRRSRRLTHISMLKRLCWVGARGMGASEYEPADERQALEPESIRLDAIAENIDRVLAEQASGEALATLSNLNGSSGGARPKIVCLVSDDYSRLARGSMVTEDMVPWIIKFRSSYDARDQGIQEYIVSVIAKRAGINMTRTHLFTSPGDAWFGIERFDRNQFGKLHMCSVAGLLECDFRIPALDYSHILMMTGRLASREDVLEQFRRAVFNYSIGNCDDHAKNFSFLMDANGQWRVSPAYDLVPSEAIGGEHMTTVCGRGKNVGRDTFYELAKDFKIPKREATLLLDEVADAVSGYGALAKDYGVKALKEVRPI